MTLRLSAFFEEQIRTIISEYKTAIKSSDRLRRSQRFRKKTQQDQPHATRFVSLAALRHAMDGYCWESKQWLNQFFDNDKNMPISSRTEWERVLEFALNAFFPQSFFMTVFTAALHLSFHTRRPLIAMATVIFQSIVHVTHLSFAKPSLTSPSAYWQKLRPPSWPHPFFY